MWPYRKHIVTGDLRYKLRKLFSKVFNDLENKMINYKKCKDSVKTALLSSMKFFSAKYNLTKDTFTGWYDFIISKVEKKIVSVNGKIYISTN